MDLQRLRWTKNVKRGDDAWAYSQFKAGDLFKLAWKDDEANASKPQKDDLMLLRQKGYVTHLVKVLDYKPEREAWEGDYSIYRIVEIFGLLIAIVRLHQQKQMKCSATQRFSTIGVAM